MLHVEGCTGRFFRRRDANLGQMWVTTTGRRERLGQSESDEILPVWCPEVYWGLGWTWTPSNTNPLPHQVPPTSKYPAFPLASPANDIFLTPWLVGGSGALVCHWLRIVSHGLQKPIVGAIWVRASGQPLGHRARNSKRLGSKTVEPPAMC